MSVKITYGKRRHNRTNNNHHSNIIRMSRFEFTPECEEEEQIIEGGKADLPWTTEIEHSLQPLPLSSSESSSNTKYIPVIFELPCDSSTNSKGRILNKNSSSSNSKTKKQISLKSSSSFTSSSATSIANHNRTVFIIDNSEEDKDYYNKSEHSSSKGNNRQLKLKIQKKPTSSVFDFPEESSSNIEQKEQENMKKATRKSKLHSNVNTATMTTISNNKKPGTKNTRETMTKETLTSKTSKVVDTIDLSWEKSYREQAEYSQINRDREDRFEELTPETSSVSVSIPFVAVSVINQKVEDISLPRALSIDTARQATASSSSSLKKALNNSLEDNGQNHIEVDDECSPRKRKQRSSSSNLELERKKHSGSFIPSSKKRDSLDAWLDSNIIEVNSSSKATATSQSNESKHPNKLPNFNSSTSMKSQIDQVIDDFNDLSAMLNDVNPKMLKGRVARLKKNSSPEKKQMIQKTTLKANISHIHNKDSNLRGNGNNGTVANFFGTPTKKFTSFGENRNREGDVFDSPTFKGKSISPENNTRIVAQPVKITNAKVTYGQSRSYLSHDTTADLFGENQKSLAARMRDEGLDSSDDEVENKMDVKPIHELREIGEMKRFSDEMEYIMDGLSEEQSQNVRRTSCMSLAKKLMSEKFLTKIITFGYLPKIYVRLLVLNDPIFRVLQLLVFNLLSNDIKSEVVQLLLNDSEFLSSIADGLSDSTHDPLVVSPKSKYDKRIVTDIKVLIKDTFLFDPETSDLTLYLLSISCLWKMLKVCQEDRFKQRLVDEQIVDHLVTYFLNRINEKFNENDHLDLETFKYAESMQLTVSALEIICNMNSSVVELLYNTDDFIPGVETYFMTYVDKSTSASSRSSSSLPSSPVYLDSIVTCLKLFVNLSNDKRFSVKIKRLFNQPILEKVSQLLFSDDIFKFQVPLNRNHSKSRNQKDDDDYDVGVLDEEEEDAKEENLRILDLKLLCCGLWMNLLDNHPDTFMVYLIGGSCNVQPIVGLLKRCLEYSEEIPESKVLTVYVSLMSYIMVKHDLSLLNQLQKKLKSSLYKKMIDHLREFLSFSQTTLNMSTEANYDNTTSGINSSQMDLDTMLMMNGRPEDIFGMCALNTETATMDCESNVHDFDGLGGGGYRPKKDKLLMMVSKAIELFG